MDLLKILVVLFMGLASLANANATSDVPKDYPSTLFDEVAQIHGNEEWKSSNKLLVYFWATWCTDCKAKLQGPLQQFSEQNKVPVLLVATEQNLPKIKVFLDDLKVKLPSLHDQSRSLRKQMLAYSVPTWALIEKTNNRFKILGQESGSNFEHIQNLLRGK